MTARATWFGPTDRPRAGWLHVPDGSRARAAVVICPPIGLEQVNAYRTVRRVAEELERHGFVALRLDYDGTGDSAGTPDDPGRLAAWRQSILDAVQEVRRCVPGVPVAAVGLRLGAGLLLSLLSEAAPPALAALVVWDGVLSGRAFCRHQGALGRVVGGESFADGAVDAPGFRLSSQTVVDLGGLDVTTLEQVPVPRVLVAARDHRAGATLARQPDVDRLVVAGMVELLDVPAISAVVPADAVEAVVGWLDRTLPTSWRPVTVPEWEVATVADGVSERFVRLGDLGLFGVETSPAGPAPVAARTVVLLNTAAEHHIGPVRLWTELARAWAARGVRSVRVDLSGIGDSPTRPGELDDMIYGRYEEDDLRVVLDAVAVDHQPVVMGLCSGGHLAMRAAVLFDLPAVAVNIATTQQFSPQPTGPGNELDTVLQHGWPRRLLRLLGVPDAGRDLMRRIELLTTWLPGSIWRLVVRLGLFVSPGDGLARLAGHDVTLLCGEADGVGYLTRGRRELATAQEHGLVFALVPDLDHLPMPYRQRVTLAALLTEQVLRLTTSREPLAR